MNLAKLLLILLLSSVSAFSNALDSDRNQPISIEADKAERDEKNGVTIYQGRVTLNQGTLNMTADKIVFFDANGDLEKIEATGQPANFDQQPKAGEEKVFATGNTIRYIPTEDLLQLIGNASLKQQGSLFSGETIDYDIKNKVIKGNSVNSKAEPDKRVKVIYKPRIKSAEDAP